MKRGYVGQRTKKRKRNRFLFLFFILLIGTSIFFVYSSENVDEEIVTIEKIDTEKENTVSINNLKNFKKIFC